MVSTQPVLVTLTLSDHYRRHALTMKKDELEGHYTQYHDYVSRAHAALRDCYFPEAVQFAVSSWDHIDGMLQYERRHLSAESVSIEGIDLVLKLAPLLFAPDLLDRLAVLLKSQRRIEKYSATNISDGLSEARQTVWDAYHLWSRLQQCSEARHHEVAASLKCADPHSEMLLRTWESFGAVRSVHQHGAFHYALWTSPHESIRGKCPTCGAVVKGAKHKLLEAQKCPSCRETITFVLLSDPSIAND